MNLSPSSSFSSSVTTISSNNSHDFTSKRPTPTVKCLVHILRRMFYSRTLPKNPSSDQATESNSGDGAVNCDSTPGIVARLMGLESLPENSNSLVTSSRSVGYVKRRGEEVTVKSLKSLSNYIELEDDEFFILSFERGSEIKELRPRKRKLKKRREKKDETEKNRAEQIGEVGASNCVEGDQSDTQPQTSKRKSKDRSSLRIKQVEAECSSEDLSPVSVLDYGEFIRDPEPKSSDDSGLESSKPRWKLSTELQTVEQSLPREDGNSINDPELKKISEGSSQKDFHSEEFSGIWSEIRKIMEREMVESNWAQKGLWRIEECEGIGSELELEIFDHLLDEVLEDQFS